MQAGFDQVAAATQGPTAPRRSTRSTRRAAIYGPADDSFLAEMIALAGGDPDHDRQPASRTSRSRSSSPPTRRSSSSATPPTASTPEIGRQAARLGHDDGGQGRRDPADRRHRSSPGPDRGSPTASWPSPSPIHPELASALPERRPGRVAGRLADGRRDAGMASPSERSARRWPMPAGSSAFGPGRRPCSSSGSSPSSWSCPRRGGWAASSVAPADTLAILAHRLLGARPRRDLDPGGRDDRLDLRLPRVLTAMVVGLGLAVAGRDVPGPPAQPAGRPVRARHGVGRRARGGDRACCIPVRIVVLEFGLLQVLAFVGALLAVTVVYRLRRTGRLAPMTSLLLTGYAVGSLLAAGLAMAMYLSGHEPAPDLLLPARRLRGRLLAAARRCRADHPRRRPSLILLRARIAQRVPPRRGVRGPPRHRRPARAGDPARPGRRSSPRRPSPSAA